MQPIEVFVEGVPRAQPRPRAFARKMGKGADAKYTARVYDDGSAEGWKSLIATAFRPHLPAEPEQDAVRVDVTFLLPRPKGHYGTGRNAATVKESSPRFPTGKPDYDNFVKAVLDALTQIGLWRDDAQVVSAHIRKRYATGAPGARIIVSAALED